MKISISTNNKKTNNIPSFSLLPLITCSVDACKTCGKNCYAAKMCRIYSNVKSAWVRNTELAYTDLPELKNQLSAWLTMNEPRYFRIHVGGDFFSREYLKMWVELAKENPDTIFYGYTKQYEIFNSYNGAFPQNFRFYFSAWVGVELPENRHNLPVAWYQDGTETRMETGTTVCSGSCRTCKHCIEGKKDIVFNKH